jgi:hypothetical protein
MTPADAALPEWPPLITAARRSRWIRVRDALLTLLMWGLLGLILYTEGELVWSGIEVLRGKPDAVVDAELELFVRRMRPLLLLMAALVLALALATLVSRDRRRRALKAAPPPPLGDAVLAERAGIGEAALAEARNLQIAVVHRAGDAALRVEPWRSTKN